MDKLPKIVAWLKAMTLAQRGKIAKTSGVPFKTLQKIAIGATTNPQYQTWLKIDRVYSRRMK